MLRPTNAQTRILVEDGKGEGRGARVTVVYTAGASGRPEGRDLFWLWKAGVGVGCSSFWKNPSPRASQLQQLPILTHANHVLWSGTRLDGCRHPFCGHDSSLTKKQDHDSQPMWSRTRCGWKARGHWGLPITSNTNRCTAGRG